MLCLIDTRLFAIPQTFVILCEVVIVATTLAYSVAHWNAAMTPMALLLLFSAVLWLVVSLLAQAVNLMIIRDMMIPPVFMMLGIASAHNRLPGISSVYLLFLVFAMAVFEATEPDQFTRFLNVENYYIGTRGFTGGQFWNGKSDLFLGATRPDQRYLLPFLNIHRLSSIFLEPVSLGNFVAIVAIVLLAYREVISSRLFWALLVLDDLTLMARMAASRSVCALPF